MPSQPAFPFRYRHELTGKWVRARWKATAEEIAERGGEITGPAEIIEDLCGSGFQPYRLMTHAELVTTTKPQPDMQPAIDACERFLLTVFLRRYRDLVCAHTASRSRGGCGGAVA